MFCGCREFCNLHEVCEDCLKKPSVAIAGKQARFCFLCAKFEAPELFDGNKRSCRKQLEKLTLEKKKRHSRLIANSPTQASPAAVEKHAATAASDAVVNAQAGRVKRQRVEVLDRSSTGNTHAEQLVKRLQEVLEEEPESCDLTLVADGDVNIRMHSIMARALAPGLKVALPSLVGTVKMAGMRSSALQAMVRYMYYGELEVTDANIEATSNAATSMRIKGAQEMCRRFFQDNVSPLNALSLYATAITDGMNDLKDKVMGCIDKNFEVCQGLRKFCKLQLTKP